MARRRDNFVFAPHDKRRYPWHEWLDGSVWELQHGVDFTVPASQFRSATYQVAARRGLAVRTALIDAETLVIQALPIEPNGRPA